MRFTPTPRRRPAAGVRRQGAAQLLRRRSACFHPGQEKKKLVVLRYLLGRCFAEDRPYPEKEVNQPLALYHPDVASLRRFSWSTAWSRARRASTGEQG
jgi:hypothetical protein